MPDQDGYPTEPELALCKSMQDFDVLMLHVMQIWHWPERVVADPYKWKLSTGGWSGNEDIIDALKHNTMFWLFCWQLSQRGGYYVFQTPQQAREERDDEDVEETDN